MSSSRSRRLLPALRSACAALRTLLLAAPFAFAAPIRAHEGAPTSHAPTAVKQVQKDWGVAGDARAAKRTVDVTMADTMRFSPERIEVRLGETVRFVVRNSGVVMHEFVIGTRAENDAHAAAMARFPGMQHDEPWMAHVPPGKSGQIVWTFNRAGTFDFACLIAGHAQAGMRGTLVVAAK